MSTITDYARALGQLEGAVKAALVELDHNFYVDAKRRLREALARAEEIVSKEVPSHHLVEDDLHCDLSAEGALVPVSENVEGPSVLEPGLDQPDTTEEKRGER